MYFTSMTKTLTACGRNPEVLDLIAAPDAKFVFSCLRHHVFEVFGNEQTAPCELTWVDDSVEREWGDQVNLADMPEHLQQLWTRFRDILKVADDEGRIWWGAGRGTDQGEKNPFFTSREWLNVPAITRVLFEQGHEVYGENPEHYRRSEAL